MKFKKDVNPIGIRPELMIALFIADGVWYENNKVLVVTSLNDSKHSRTSLHYSGQAADLRTNYFDAMQVANVVNKLTDALGNNPDYDVVLEIDHIHLEWQPKINNQ